MIKTWIKCTAVFFISCIFLVICAACWLVLEAGKAFEVMDRFGGIDVVGDWSFSPSGVDDIYIRSVNPLPQQDIVYEVRALQPCVAYSRDCMLQEAAAINLQMISTRMVLKDVDEFFDKYKPYAKTFDDGCPVVHETTMLIKESEALRRMTEDRARLTAKQLMEKIKREGGLTYSLLTPECQSFFRGKPYMVRAYTFHLALLMHRAEGRFSASWLFLAALPDRRSVAR